MNKEFENGFLLFLMCGLLFGIAFLVFSVSLYGIAFHNIDLGQNIMVLNAKYNVEFGDTTSTGEDLTAKELYSHGLNQLRKSFLMGLASAFAVGFFMIVIFLEKINIVDKGVKTNGKKRRT